MPAWVWVLLAALCLIRLPAIVQPLGPDQGIYAYVGQTILDGGLPYRDAWDQKPPGLHAFYALLWWIWPNEAIVPLADACLAWLVALMLWRMAPRFGASSAAGPIAAGTFLLFGNPAFSRLAGIRIRGQGEVFIGALVTVALWAMLRAREGFSTDGWSARRAALMSGFFVGLAAIVKYQAAIYAAPLMAVVLVPDAAPGLRAPRARLLLWMLGGFLTSVVAMVAVFAAEASSRALWDATVVYNIRYAGETYAGVGSFLVYLLSFPIQHARVDALWLLGGAGSAILLVRSPARRVLLIPLAWTAAACLSIAVNGSRSLPQYFVQALPPLALSAGLAADAFRSLSRTQLGAGVLVVSLAVARVVSFPDAFDATAWDTSHLVGRIDRATYLSRFKGRPGDKYSAPDAVELGAWLGQQSRTSDAVYIFGFSSSAYVYSGRRSASRFFWSTPVINRFNDGRNGYGASGLLEDLRTGRPRLVALQRDDFGPGSQFDSRSWFLGQPGLREWLVAHYRPVGSLDRYELWERVD